MKPKRKNKKQSEKVIELIQSIKYFGTGFPTNSFIKNYTQFDSFTPKQLLVLFKQFNTCGIKFSSENFRLSLNTKTQQDDISEMSEADINIIWDALSKDQKKWYMQGGWFD